ncbi:MAG: DUF4124 domain-containing protein [Gammaproteobacteria bacterium]|nr:DUF4124 domain-containing protein [Gammaproteobacteria bacterium]
MYINRETINQYIRQIALFGILSLTCTQSIAGIYKWVDAEGNIHYGQQRPADATSEKMDVQQYAPRDTSSYNRPGSKNTDENSDTVATDEADKKDLQPAEPEKKVETAAEKKRRLAACAQARKNLSTMLSVGRVRSKDKDGNVTYMSQAQKEEKISQAKSLIAKHCK